jgi:uncharacterized protein YvpB
MDRLAILQAVSQVAPAYGLSPVLVAAVAEQESSFDPTAHREEPQIGDASRGLMQELLGTARWMGFDGEPSSLYDVRTNLEVGCRFLRFLMHRYGGHVPTALAAYNAGPGNADSRGWQCARTYVQAVLARAPHIRDEMGAAELVVEDSTDYGNRTLGRQVGAGGRSALQPFRPFPLPVPFVSQLEPDGKGYNNCGPACVTMALAYNGHAPASRDVMHRVAEEIRRVPWYSGTYTDFAHMRDAANRYGIAHRELSTWDDVVATLDRGQPVLILVDNTLLEPRQYPRTPAFNAHHFVILAGYTEADFHVADPLSVDRRAIVAYTRSSVTAAVAGVGGVQALAIDEPVPLAEVADKAGLWPRDGEDDMAVIRISDEDLKAYLEQLGQGVNMESAIVKRACLAYRRGETRGPAVSDEYPARAPDGREVVRQRFSAGIAEWDPATGEVNWVEVVLHPEAPPT